MEDDSYTPLLSFVFLKIRKNLSMNLKDLNLKNFFLIFGLVLTNLSRFVPH